MSHEELFQALERMMAYACRIRPDDEDSAHDETESTRVLVTQANELRLVPADVFYLLKNHGRLFRWVHESADAAYSALLLILWMVLEGPMGSLAEAIANGMREYCQSLVDAWTHSGSATGDKKKRTEPTQHVSRRGAPFAACVSELSKYICEKLSFHEQYLPFESNYSLERFLKRYDIESLDPVQEARNQRLHDKVFSTEASADLLSVLHRLLEAEHELSLRGYVSYVQENGQVVTESGSRSRERGSNAPMASGMQALISFMAYDAANLYEMLLYLISKMYSVSATQQGSRRIVSHADKIEERKELASLFQELCTHLRTFFDGAHDTDLASDLPVIPYQLLLPSPDAEPIESRFPRLVVTRFTRFQYLHQAWMPQMLNATTTHK